MTCKKEEDIFVEDKRIKRSDSANKLSTIPYLKRGDSNIYINQFLAKEE